MANKRKTQQTVEANSSMGGNDKPTNHHPLRIIVLSVVIAVGIILVAIIIYAGIKYFTGRNDPTSKFDSALIDEPMNKVSIEEWKGVKYYVMNGDYGGNYDIQYTNLYPEFSGGAGKAGEWRNFSTVAIMSYDEYVAFCDKWRLAKTYSNQDDRYLVAAYAGQNYTDIIAKLAGVAYSGDAANLYIWDSSSGAAASIVAYAIIVPTDSSNVESVEVTHVLSKDEWGELSCSPEIYRTRQEMSECTGDYLKVPEE